MNSEFTKSELTVRYDAHKSFYNKAMVEESKDGKIRNLYSYNTHVATVETPITGTRLATVHGDYSPTTLRHIKEFLKQNGFRADTKSQIMRDY